MITRSERRPLLWTGITGARNEVTNIGGIFDETVIRNLLADRSEAARKVLGHRAGA
jgi:ATP-dependent exoDNAse (exonuclease V) alpha subunit